MHCDGVEARHWAQFELEEHAMQVWLNRVASLLTKRAKPWGQTTQSALALQEVSVTQFPPWSRYPFTQETQDKGLLTSQVAQGDTHSTWHLKFWFKKYPSVHDKHPIDVHESQLDGQLVPLTHTLLPSNSKPGAH